MSLRFIYAHSKEINDVAATPSSFSMASRKYASFTLAPPPANKIAAIECLTYVSDAPSSEFFVTLKDHYETEKGALKRALTFAERFAPMSPPDLATVEEGKVEKEETAPGVVSCCAKSITDGNWYRAVIIRRSSNSSLGAALDSGDLISHNATCGTLRESIVVTALVNSLL